MTALNPGSWSAIGRNAAYPLNVTAIPLKAIWPYLQQWSTSVERQLPSGILGTFAYVGSKGTHLTAERQLNQLPPVTANPFPAGQPLIRNGYNPLSGSFKSGDCSTDQANDSFVLLDGQVVGPNSPGFVNMQAACFGAVSAAASGSNPGLGANPNSLREFAPGMGEIYSLENAANSSYNAFQATIRRVVGASTIGVAYTYSHSLDDASDRSDATFVNSFDLKSNRASSNFDQRHLFHLSYVYQLPLIPAFDHLFHFMDAEPDNQAANYPGHTYNSSDWPSSKVVQTVLGGWEISGITVYETGIPFTVVNNGSPAGISTLDNAGVANGQGAGSYPDRIANASTHLPGVTKTAGSIGPLLLNPGAFGAPQGLSFGNAGRNALNNPSRWNWDTALLKRFPINERIGFEFRAEAFNVFNNTQFRIYNPTLGNQAQNTISCYGGAASSYSGAGGDGVDCLTGGSFLHPVDAHRPRTLQFALKLAF
jgi:hypothetical protein